MGFELVVCYLNSLLSEPQHLIIYGNNTGVIEGWGIGRHHNQAVNEIFKLLHAFIESSLTISSVASCYIPVPAIQPIGHLGASMVQPTSHSLPSLSWSTYETSSQTLPTPSLPKSSDSLERAGTQLPHLTHSAASTPSKKSMSILEQRPLSRMSSSLVSSRTVDSSSSHFNSPLPSPSPHPELAGASKPCPYQPNLRPLPSPNCPHCLARDRLRLWRPANPSMCPADGVSSAIMLESMLDQILEVIGALWADSTKELYGTGLLIFHLFCNFNRISELECCPMSRNLLTFLSSCTGAYSGLALTNYSAGLRAWHLLHGHLWTIDLVELKHMLQGAARLAPCSSKKPKWPPMTWKTSRSFIHT